MKLAMSENNFDDRGDLLPINADSDHKRHGKTAL
jgi:hypothetical protein